MAMWWQHGSCSLQGNKKTEQPAERSVPSTQTPERTADGLYSQK